MQRRRKRRSRALPLLLALGIIGVGLYLHFQRPAPQRTPVEEPVPAPPAPPPREPALEPPEEIEERLELPPLSESDPFLRQLAAALSAHPSWAAWLAEEGLIRRFVAAVDNVAEGKSPRSHLRFLAPRQPFEVVVRGERVLFSSQNARRYDAVAAVFASLDTEGCVRLYRKLRPLIDQVYQDLGYPEGDFDETLRRAIAGLLETPLPQGEIDLVPGVLSYEFLELEFEELSAAQKHLLRMGPRNARRIQEKLREFSNALGTSAVGSDPT